MDATITYELATPEDYDEIVEFANFVFSYAHRPHEFKTLISKAYGETRPKWPVHFVARENGRIRGLVGLCVFPQRVLDETLKIGFIGTVSVHPYSRGRGYMKRLMAMAGDYARQNHLDLLALGGQRQRYEYYGYEPGGISYSLNVTTTNCRHALSEVNVSNIRFEPFERMRERMGELHAIYESGIVAGARPAEHFEQICGTWYNLPYAIMNGDEIDGYLIASTDRKSILELRLNESVSPEKVVKAYLGQFALNNVHLLVPPHRPEQLRPLARLCENVSLNQNESFQIINYERVVSCYLKLKQRVEGALPDGRLALGLEDEGKTLSVCIENGTISCSLTDDAPEARFCRLDAQNLLLSPVPYVNPTALADCARRYFPLPVCIEGADGF